VRREGDGGSWGVGVDVSLGLERVMMVDESYDFFWLCSYGSFPRVRSVVMKILACVFDVSVLVQYGSMAYISAKTSTMPRQ
jgi:hypothetical protein